MRNHNYSKFKVALICFVLIFIIYLAKYPVEKLEPGEVENVRDYERNLKVFETKKLTNETSLPTKRFLLKYSKSSFYFCYINKC